MPRGASAKREREYEELKQKFQKSHRYPGRASEVAARIVNKQRAQYGETKGDKRKDREGRSPDKNLPGPFKGEYQHMTVSQVVSHLDDLSRGDLRKVKAYEEKHKHRKSLLVQLDRRL